MASQDGFSVPKSLGDWIWWRSDALRRARQAERSGDEEDARYWYQKKRFWSALIIGALAAAYASA